MTDLPPGWEWAPLDDLCWHAEIVEPVNLDRPTFQYIDIGAVNSEGKISPTPTACDKAPGRARRLVRSGDTVFSTVRPYLKKIALVPPEFDGEIASTGFCILRPNGTVPEYLYYLVQSDVFMRELLPKQRGVSYPAVRDKDILEIQVPVPPLAEQRRIAQTLEAMTSSASHADTLIDSIAHRCSDLERSVASLAVTGRLLDQPAVHSMPTDEELSRIIKQRDSLARRKTRRAWGPVSINLNIPGHWTVCSLDQISWNIQYGTSAKASRVASSGAIPVIRMGNIQNGRLDITDLKYLPIDHPDVAALTLKDGDVLINRTNSMELVGKSAVYRPSLGPATFASYLIRSQLVPGIEPDWVALVINSPYGRNYMKQVASQQVGQANVNGTKLAKMPIPIPPLLEQQEILTVCNWWIDYTDRLLSQCRATHAHAHVLTRSILQKAFSGGLTRQDPEDEPASELLARIRAERAAVAPKRRGRRPGVRARGVGQVQKETLL